MSKNNDFLNRIGKFFKEFSQNLAPAPTVKKEPKKPEEPPNLFEIIRFAAGTIMKIFDIDFTPQKDTPAFMKPIFEINQDAERAFNDGRYSYFVELKYRGTEIFYRSFYEHVFEKSLSGDTKMQLTDIIQEVELELGVNSGVLKELNKWRVVRNNIVHEHLKISKQEAIKAKRFFNKLYSLFETYVKKAQ